MTEPRRERCQCFPFARRTQTQLLEDYVQSRDVRRGSMYLWYVSDVLFARRAHWGSKREVLRRRKRQPCGFTFGSRARLCAWNGVWQTERRVDGVVDDRYLPNMYTTYYFCLARIDPDPPKCPSGYFRSTRMICIFSSCCWSPERKAGRSPFPARTRRPLAGGKCWS